jgi:hypothetical protein
VAEVKKNKPASSPAVDTLKNILLVPSYFSIPIVLLWPVKLPISRNAFTMHGDDESHRHTMPRAGRVLTGCLSRGLKVVSFLLPRAFNERFAFTFVAFSIIISKIIHIVANERGLPRRHLALWSFSFVTQDLILLLLLRYSIDRSNRKNNALHVPLKVGALAVMAFSAAVSLVNISFFAYTGSEVRWRNVSFVSESSSRSVLMSGLASFLAVLFALLFLTACLQNTIFSFAQVGIDIVKLPFIFVREYRNMGAKTDLQYCQLPRTSFSGELSEKGHQWRVDAASQSTHWAPRALWAVAILSEILAFVMRPSIGSLTYISWTAPLFPFVDFKESSSNLQGLRPVYRSGLSALYDNKTALSHPVPFSWLPRGTVLPGFEDWYQIDGKHYSAAADPLKISNLDEEVLLDLQHALSDVSIKHVMLVVLESTRKDVFPIKKKGLVWNRFAETYENNELPDYVANRLQTLTPVANHLTGDFQDGFSTDARQQKARGGINFNDAFTSATYTLKSLVGIMCGIWPLVADLNQEYLHHVYQPCLPQVLAALTRVDEANTTQDGTRSKWRSHFLQSVTLGYDNSDIGTQQFGFPRENIIDSRYLRSDAAQFGTVNVPDINYFGFEEPQLLDYIRDAFSSAKANGERLFLTHLTSTTHHPYTMPANETVVPLGSGRLKPLSNYINSIGYDDRWLGQILSLLDDEQVADETLVIFTGDHGISLPENDKPASYYNPNTGCNHVPLIFSHPKLPPIDVSGPVSTMEILPTVLDLLRETGSLTDAANSAAGDLLANYEGQSLIRTLRNSAARHSGAALSKVTLDAKDDIMSNWQFIVMNPGRAMVGIRDRRRTNLSLVVPVIKNVVWRFNDLTHDPRDESPIEAFNFETFLHEVEQTYSRTEAEWAEEAAFVVRWFVDENNKRWQYGEYALPENEVNTL